LPGLKKVIKFVKFIYFSKIRYTLNETRDCFRFPLISYAIFSPREFTLTVKNLKKIINYLIVEEDFKSIMYFVWCSETNHSLKEFNDHIPIFFFKLWAEFKERILSCCDWLLDEWFICVINAVFVGTEKFDHKRLQFYVVFIK